MRNQQLELEQIVRLRRVRQAGVQHQPQPISEALPRAGAERLRRLQTDYIDLYQMHIQDPLTTIEETLRALEDIVSAGKVRYVGCSNFLAWEVVEGIQIARSNGWPEFATVQPEFSMFEREV